MFSPKKTITILGSTGSIGKNTVKVVQQLKDRFDVYGIAANSNVELLARQSNELNCKDIVCGEPYKRRNKKVCIKRYKC